MTIYSDDFIVKIGAYGTNIYEFKYSFNENTIFQELLEFMSSIIPEICCMCPKFYFKEKYKKVDINNEERIYKYKKYIQHLNLNCYKCHCEKDIKYYIKMTKLDLCKKIKELEKENYDLKKEKKNFNNELEDLKKENNKLNNRINELEEENNSVKKENQDIYNVLKNAGDNEMGIINQLKIIGQKKNDSIFKNNNYKINNTQIKGKEKYLDVDFKKFYDVIINISSIKDITKGWEIKKSQRIIDNYKEIKSSKIIKIGVIGNSNKIKENHLFFQKYQKLIYLQERV